MVGGIGLDIGDFVGLVELSGYWSVVPNASADAFGWILEALSLVFRAPSIEFDTPDINLWKTGAPNWPLGSLKASTPAVGVERMFQTVAGSPFKPRETASSLSSRFELSQILSFFVDDRSSFFWVTFAWRTHSSTLSLATR